MKWNDTFAELLGETVPFLHAIDGSVSMMALEDDGVESAEVSTSKHHLNIPFVLSIIQTFAQRDCTVHVAPVSDVRHAAHWYKPGVWCVMTNPSRMVLLSSMVQLNGMYGSLG